jgi:predicted double-glycine peptidase
MPGMRALALSLAVIAGCAVSRGPALPKQSLSVPLVRQATNYSCGAAALLAVLFYWQVFDGREDELYAALGTDPEHGTQPESIARVARAHGLRASVEDNLEIRHLAHHLARGATAIVSLQAWRDEDPRAVDWKNTWEDGHYAVLVGLDERHAYFMDPSAAGAYAFVPLKELVDRWHDYESASGRRMVYNRAAVIIEGKHPARRSLVRME